VVVVFVVVLMTWQGRERTHRLTCGANMKAIGAALAVYCASYPGSTASSLEQLAEEGLLPREVMTCPSSSRAASNYIVVWENVMGNPLANDAIIVYEPKSNHGGDGGNVLFADGHVSFMVGPEYDRLLAALPSPATPTTDSDEP